MKVVFSVSVFMRYMRTEGQSPIFHCFFKNYGYLWEGPLIISPRHMQRGVGFVFFVGSQNRSNDAAAGIKIKGKTI